MRRAAPSLWQHLPSVPRGSGSLALFIALGFTAACSVYTTELLEETTGITAGGTDTAGHTSNNAGSSSSTTGGKPNVELPSAGGEGGDPAGPDATGGTGGGSPATGGNGPTGGVGIAGTASGGSAGTAGTSGTAGTGGTVTGGPSLLDDFEDENLTVEQTDTRGGVWYTFTDGTAGTVAPTPLVCAPNSGAPEALGGYAMHITATGFKGTGTVGSGLGVDFRNLKKVYDASAFTGIRFWAKVGSGKNTKHRVQIADATTDKAGGKCNSDADAPNGEKCDDHFGSAQTFTTTWTQYTVLFNKLTQLGWGNSAEALDKAHLYGLQFTAAPKVEVDLWLDQIEFF